MSLVYRHRLFPATLALLSAITACGLGGGIGGTGITAGIGGTGITAYGPVQRLGSIFVNGREYYFGKYVDVTIDGSPADSAELRSGDMVLVAAQLDPRTGSTEALHIQMEHAIMGPVGAVNRATNSITVLNQHIEFAPHAHTALADLHSGDWVAVSALQRADGIWSATRIERVQQKTVSGHFILTGTIGPILADKGEATIAGLTLHVAAQQLQGLHPGEIVRAMGNYKNHMPHVVKIESAMLLLGRPGTLVEMSGYIQKTSTSDGVMSNGYILHYPAVSAPAILPDQEIAVRGTLTSDGSIEAQQLLVDIDPLRVELPAPPLNPAIPEMEHSEQGRPEVEREKGEPPEVERPGIERPELEPPGIEQQEMQ